MNCRICLLSLLLASASQAAITITVSPDAGGTMFRITQESPNPMLVLDAVTTGTISVIPLAAEAFSQNPSLFSFTELFGSPLGVLSESTTSASSQLAGFQFFHDIPNSIYVPALVLATMIDLPPNNSYQFSWSDLGGSSVSLDFSNFVVGTYLKSDPIFGEVKTVVIPEPGVTLMLLGSLVALGHRRRPNH